MDRIHADESAALRHVSRKHVGPARGSWGLRIAAVALGALITCLAAIAIYQWLRPRARPTITVEPIIRIADPRHKTVNVYLDGKPISVTKVAEGQYRISIPFTDADQQIVIEARDGEGDIIDIRTITMPALPP